MGLLCTTISLEMNCHYACIKCFHRDRDVVEGGEKAELTEFPRRHLLMLQPLVLNIQNTLSGASH